MCLDFLDLLPKLGDVCHRSVSYHSLGSVVRKGEKEGRDAWPRHRLVPNATMACSSSLAPRALQAYLGHRNIQHTVRYTELSPGRFKDFFR